MPPISPPAVMSAELAGIHGAVILNVDDNDGNRYVKTRVLSRAGFEVLEARSGEEALSLVLQHSPGLVLLDVKLPDINGLEVCRRIKSDPRTSTVLVLQTSAAAVHTTDRVRALDLGADSYLTEPIEPTELIANVRALLRLRRAEAGYRSAELALRESEQRFRQLAENIDDVFWILDPRTDRLLYVSPAYASVWGRDPADLRFDGELWSPGVHPDDRPRVERAFALLRSSGQYEQEYRVVRPDGSIRWIRERGFPVSDASGNIYRLAGVASDISQRKAHELSLSEGDRRKDQFLAMLAHELRNPLAPIRNAVEIMQPRQASRLAEPAQLEHARRIIARQVNHLSRLVDDLLDVSRITQGKITLRPALLDLGVALSAALETARPVLEQKKHDFNLTVPSQPMLINGDAVRIAQVFGNLLSNAAKYTPAGGSLRIVASRQGQNATVTVTDNGIGIDAGILPHIFELFVQSETSLERAEGGLGIGLPLAKTLVELHGGSVEAYSRGPGNGCEFLVRLPLAEAAQSTHRAQEDSVENATQAASAAAEPAGRKILLVDDSVDAAMAMTMLLESYGHQVETVHDGHAALDAALRFEPEIVVLDIGLPGMDGFEVARELRRRAGTQQALMIALTGYGQAADRQRSRDAGFDHHLVKPASVSDIEAAIKQFRSSNT